MHFQIIAAIIAPITGAIMKSQSCERASPPTKIAGPKLLAGFTEVPVIGILTKWIRTSEKPIEIPANPSGAFLLVEPKITKRNMNVKTTSAIKHATREYFAGDWEAYPF